MAAKGGSVRDGAVSRVHDAELRTEVAARLRGVRQRLTGNREAVVAVLAQAGRPLTIPEILAEGRDLAQSSVYRNLTVLEQAGVVHRLVTDHDFARYELAESLTEHHHHLICDVCGAVEDFHASEALEELVASAADQIARRTGFHTRVHRLDLVGRCRDCA